MNVSAVGMSGAISRTSEAAGTKMQSPSRPAQVAGDVLVSNENIRRQVAEMQQQIGKLNISLAFTTYGDHGEKIAVVVADKETGEVIREIPSKEIQRLHAKMSELAGMILNGQA